MTYLELFLQNVLMALQAFGGAMATLPALDKLQWMDSATLAHLAAIGQASPGPNMLLLPLVGWKVLGIPGALIAALGFCLPSAALVLALHSRWSKVKNSPWKVAISSALVPLGAAAIMASTLTFGRIANVSLAGLVVVMLVALASMKTKTPPVLFIALGGLIGMLGIL